MISKHELRWMRENGDDIMAEMEAHEQRVSIYVHPDGARATCRGGICKEITGMPTPGSLDYFELEPQIGWSAGQLKRAGFVKQEA